MLCENAGRQASQIVPGGCWNRTATRHVEIIYDQDGVDKDELDLCDKCAGLVVRDARRHDYTTHNRKIL